MTCICLCLTNLSAGSTTCRFDHLLMWMTVVAANTTAALEEDSTFLLDNIVFLFPLLCSVSFTCDIYHKVNDNAIKCNRAKFDNKIGSKHVRIILECNKIRCALRVNDSYIFAILTIMTLTCCRLREDMIAVSISLTTVGREQNFRKD